MLLLEDGVAVALMADSAFKQNKGKKNKNGLGSKLTPTKRAQKMPVYVSLQLGQLLDYSMQKGNTLFRWLPHYKANPDSPK